MVEHPFIQAPSSLKVNSPVPNSPLNSINRVIWVLPLLLSKVRWWSFCPWDDICSWWIIDAVSLEKLLLGQPASFYCWLILLITVHKHQTWTSLAHFLFKPWVAWSHWSEIFLGFRTQAWCLCQGLDCSEPSSIRREAPSEPS